jgi:hypothetical protein
LIQALHRHDIVAAASATICARTITGMVVRRRSARLRNYGWSMESVKVAWREVIWEVESI